MDQQLKKKEHVLRNFFTPDGALKHLPAQFKKKLIVLEHIVSSGLQPGRNYSEREINDYIKPFDEDFATIRREFIIHGYMSRENGIYTLNPPELWTRWETLN